MYNDFTSPLMHIPELNRGLAVAILPRFCDETAILFRNHQLIVCTNSGSSRIYQHPRLVSQKSPTPNGRLAKPDLRCVQHYFVHH